MKEGGGGTTTVLLSMTEPKKGEGESHRITWENLESWEKIFLKSSRKASESRHMLVVCVTLFGGGGGCGGRLNGTAATLKYGVVRTGYIGRRYNCSVETF